LDGHELFYTDVGLQVHEIPGTIIYFFGLFLTYSDAYYAPRRKIGGAMGTTEAIRIRKGLSIYKQPLRQGRGSPYWYARVYMLIGDRDTHTRSTRTADTKAAIERAEDFWGDCKLWQRGGPEHFPEALRRTDTSRRFDRVADSWLAELERDAGSDSRRLRNPEGRQAQLSRQEWPRCLLRKG
jgi:hypothetical protein